MKRLIHCRSTHCLGAVVFCCLLVQSALGSIDISLSPLPVAGDWVKFSGAPGVGTLASTSAGLAGGTNTWNTFCVEAGAGVEYIVPGTGYVVGSLSDTVASATGNIVTDAARYLYVAYGSMALTGTNAAFQDAIWSLVKVSSAGDTGINSYPALASGDYLFATAGAGASLRAAAITAVTTDANAAANQALAATVHIINPVTLNPNGTVNTNQQSFLYQVPEATTIVVWSVLGLIGLVGRRQRG
jgi:hypothetical protein